MKKASWTKPFQNLNWFKNRNLRANFDAAGGGRRLKNWLGTNESINSLIFSNIEVLRKRARQTVLNNPSAANAINVLTANCIGTGIKPQSRAKDADFRENIHNLWNQWNDECDFYGLTDFYGLQSLICQSMLEGGSCLVKFKIDHNNETIPLKLQVLEPEHLNKNIDGLLSNGNTAKSGIEFDKEGRRAAYHLYSSHPGEQHNAESGSDNYVRIEAENILHIFKPIRPGQVEGVPWLASILLKLHELEQYDDAELVRKKTAALFTGFITKADLDGNAMGENDSQDIASVDLVPGLMQVLSPGEDIKFADPADVGGSYEIFMKTQLRFIAMGMGITYEQLTGDLSGVNYSSIRAGLIEFRRRCQMLQKHIIIYQLCRPVWNKWLQLGILSNKIKLPDDNYKSVRWVAQGWEWVDPLKDQKALATAVKSGFVSKAEAVSRQGHDIEDIDMENHIANKRAKKLGLAYDTDTGIEDNE